jgi:2,4-dienoyl-CoA reductase-like NADH-dependent reductase (Old Yellow Enzyme family)
MSWNGGSLRWSRPASTCSTRRFWEPEFQGSALNLAGWTKKITGKPSITVGSIGLDNDFVAGLMERRAGNPAAIERLVAMIECGEVDLVAVGRALLVDPAWATKIRDGRIGELLAFTPEATKTLF